jgi:hypothetical protein
MPGHSRLKDGVASLAYGAGHPRLASRLKAWMAGTNRAFTPVFDGLCPAMTMDGSALVAQNRLRDNFIMVASVRREP